MNPFKFNEFSKLKLYFKSTISSVHCTQAHDTESSILAIFITTHILSAATLAPGVRFSKVSETFRARKAVLTSSVSKDREECTSETSCMKGTSFHIKNTRMNQLCNQKLRDLLRLSGCETFSGPSRNGPLVLCIFISLFRNKLSYTYRV